jgi:TP901 family phage tail tape measure protein
MLSQLGALGAADATEALTSTINSYKMAAEDAVSIVDRLVAVDNVAATSTRELATALRYVAVVASEAGVTLDELISYIGVISSTTRLNAEQIGQALKTIFTRMQDIKAGKLDEEGVSLNNVEAALKRVGVELRDSETSFRDLGTVLEDVSAKWDTLNEVEQANISKAVAGVRQANMFKILMVNMNEALRLQEVQAAATGLATQRYTIYMEGLQAAINKSKAAWEGVWQATIESGIIKWFYDLSTAVGNTISAMHGLIAPLTIVLGLLIAIKSSAITSGIIAAGSAIVGLFWKLIATLDVIIGTTATATAGVVSLGTAATISTGGLVLIIGAVVALTAAIIGYVNSIPTVEEAIISLAESSKKTADELKTLTDESVSLKALINEFKSAKTGSDEYYASMEKIHQLMPDVNGYYDSQGRFVLILADNISTLNDEYEDLIANKKLLLIETNNETAATLSKQAKHIFGEQTRDWARGMGGPIPTVGDITPETQESLDGLANSYVALYASMKDLGQRDGMKSLLEDLKTMGVFGQMATLRILEFRDATSNARMAARNLGLTLTEDIPEPFNLEEFVKVTESLITETDELNSVMQKQKDETLTSEDILKLVAAHAEYGKYLTIENGIVTLNTDLMRYNNIAKIQAQIATIKASLAAAEYGKALLKENNQLLTQKKILEALLLVASKPIVVTSTAGGSGASAEDAYKKALEESYRATIKIKEAEKDRLKALLDAYKKIIDKKKESLKLAKEEVDFERELDKKQRVSADIMAELESIKLDNSEEAAARRMELEQELADNTAEIEEFQADRSYDLQIQALDREYELYKEFIDAQIALIDKLIASIQAMIDALKSAKSASTGGGQSPVLPAPPSTPSNSVGNWVNPPRERGGGNPRLFVAHSGAESGFVGGLKSNEEFAKLMKGELVINKPQMENFMNKSLPQMVSTATNEINFEMPINVNGPLDKTVLPDIEKIVNKAFEKMNSALMNRGYKRAVNQFTS